MRLAWIAKVITSELKMTCACWVQAPLSNNSSDISGASNSQIKNENVAHHTQLEPNKIPEFGGNVLERQYYIPCIWDSRVDFTNIQFYTILHYLYNSLRGRY